MNAGGPGQGGQSGTGSTGSGSGAGSGSQNNGQVTTTTSVQQQQTNTANSQTQTTIATQSPTSTSSSSSSSGTQKTAIIGGIIGGIAGLLLISLLVIWNLNRRQKKRIIKERGGAEPVTYSNLNDSFSGVPFHHSNRSSQYGSLLPPQAVFTPRTGPSTPHSGVGLRGGQGHHSNSDGEHGSSEDFPPSYAESQAGMSLGRAQSLGRLNTSHTGSRSEATISLMSVRHPGGTPTTGGGLSPQTRDSTIPYMIPQQRRDTMGFLIDVSDNGMNRSSTPGLPIIVPVPRRPLVRQNSLERVAREGMDGGSEVQDMNLPSPTNGLAGRLLGEPSMRESGVLGDMNPVWIQGTTGLSFLGSGVRRFESQRPVSSVSSLGLSIVSDTELERLGVGSHLR